MLKNIDLKVFKNPNAMKLFLGQLSSQVCDKIVSVGLVWVLLEKWGQDIIPWYVALGGVPHILFLKSAPKIISKFSVLKTVYYTDFIRGVLFLLAALLLPFVGDSLLIFLFALTFISNIFGCFFNTAIFTLPVKVVRKDLFEKVSALIDSCFQLGMIIGPLFAVIFYKYWGLSGIFIINGVSFIFSGLLEVFIKPLGDDSKDEEDKRPAKRIREIFREDPLIGRMLVNFLLMNLLLAPMAVFLPVYAKDILSGEINTLAHLETSFGIGAIIGSVICSFYKIPGKTWQKIVYNLLFMAVAYFIFSISGIEILSCASLVLMGLFLSIANVVILFLYQTRPKESDIPSVMAMVNGIGIAATPFSMALMSLLLMFLNVQTLAVTFSIGIILLAIMVAFIPNIREV